MLRCNHSLEAFRLYPGQKTNTHISTLTARRENGETILCDPAAHLEKGRIIDFCFAALKGDKWFANLPDFKGDEGEEVSHACR